MSGPQSILAAVFGNCVRIGEQTWSRLRFFNPERATSRYRQALARYSQALLVDRRVDVVTSPYFDPDLMAHLRRHLPGWHDFHTEFRTYLSAEWNSIYGDWDWSDMALVVDEEQPLLQRDRLMQILEACPEGSYAYYARRGLAPFKAVVGSVASATIDRFFAANIWLLKQPMSVLVNEIMSTLETKYWGTRQNLVDYVAGWWLPKRGRQFVVATPQFLMTLAKGVRTPDLPPGEVLDAEQLAELQRILAEHLPTLDDVVIMEFCKDLYKRVEAGRATRQ